MLYSSRTIETKYFLLSNLRFKKKFGGFVRTQEFGCSNYYGEEIKNPIYETTIKSSNIIRRNKIKPINLFNTITKSKSNNKQITLRECFKTFLKPRNINKGSLTKISPSFPTQGNRNLKIIKMNFPYCKPSVKNSFTELIRYNKNKDYIIAKNIEKNKKIL